MKCNEKPKKFIHDTYPQNTIIWYSVNYNQLKIKIMYITVFYNKTLDAYKDYALLYDSAAEKKNNYGTYNLLSNNQGLVQR